MSKLPTKHEVAPNCCKSVFTLTFAIEVLGMEPPNAWEELPGWLEIGPYIQGCKIQCQLYPGQSYDIDVLIWPKVAKVWSNGNSNWIRTFQFLERKWFTFTIKHAFPVKVMELKNFVATVNVTMGTGVVSAGAKPDSNLNEVLVPPLKFGERRYFGPVLEAEESLSKYVEDLIWNCVVGYIPASYMDGLFDVPHAVTDVRHQDTCIEKIRDIILNTIIPDKSASLLGVETETEKNTQKKESKIIKEKEKGKDKDKDKDKKKPDIPKVKFEILLPGNELLAGAGRIVPFEIIGDRPSDLGEIIVLISTNNLPAQDDYPIVFVNVDNLCEIPVNEFKILRITDLYTRWIIGDEIHDSKLIPLPKSNSTINFSDHHAIPFPYETLKEITADFMDKCFEIQLRGKRLSTKSIEPKLFGYEKKDRDFGTSFPPKLTVDNLDFLIASTKIDARAMCKGPNVFLRGEYPLFPPTQTTEKLNRESLCSNDINSIALPVRPEIVVKPDLILLAQMTLEVNLGVVGCTPRKLSPGYSRMFCIIEDSEFVVPLLKFITETNEEISESGKIDDLLTGFALDTGDSFILYLEGPKDGYILHIWEKTEDFYPKVKPMFSYSSRYSTRLYPDFLLAAVPFSVFKMFAPLGVILACPQAYARPALPLPTRSALLKFGRLMGGKLKTVPSRNEMPTSAELKSFRLELCVAPRPTSIVKIPSEPEPRHSTASISRINWDK